MNREYNNRHNYGFLQLSLRADDVMKLRELKELGIIPSMSSFLHFLIIKEIQEMKKHNILRKRRHIDDRKMSLTDDYNYNLEQYINRYNNFISNTGYNPIITDDEVNWG